MRLSLYLSVVLLALPHTLQAESRTFTLQDCVAYGLKHSLALRNAAIDEAVVRNRAEAVDGAYDPRLHGQVSYTDSEARDTASFFLKDRQLTTAEFALGKAFRSGTHAELRVNHSHIQAGGELSAFLTEPYSSLAGLRLSQSILRNAFGEADRARRRGADAGGEAARLAYEREEELLAGHVADAYWNLQMARKSFDTGRDSLVRAERLLETNRSRVEDGLLDETDLLAFEALIATRRVDVLSLSNAVANAADALKNTMQLPYEAWGDVKITVADEEVAQIHPTDSEAVDVSSRKDLAALEALIEQSEAELDSRASEFRHNLQLFGEIGRGSSGEDFDGSIEFDDNAWTVGVMLDAGWGRSTERSALEEARLLHKKAINNRASLEAVIELECSVADRNLENGWDRVIKTRRARDLEQKKLALEQNKYEQGRSAINLIVQYEDDYALSSQRYNVAVATYQKAVIQYRLAHGKVPVPGVETDR
ncbi:MAG: TolC family protein [Kiritimatiellia bacterium]|nr:TolC family protein [Kiritimatiellia bacterium]MDP6809911.1 TolC family protein [Kiritimatiellia bacterium]